MPIVNRNQISLGLGNLEFGDYIGEIFDTYTDVGALKSELSIAIEREVMNFESGRPLLTIVQEVVREKVTISATLAELNLNTIKMALGQGNIYSSSIPTFLDGSSTALSGTLQTGKTAVTSGMLMKFGGLATHAYIGIRFTNVTASGSRRIFEGYKASPTGRLTLPFREADWNLYNVEFVLLADTCRNGGEQYFQIFQENLAVPPSCLQQP